MAKRDLTLSAKQSMSSTALRNYERPRTKQLRLSVGSFDDVTASSSDLQTEKPFRNAEEAIAAYRLSLQTPTAIQSKPRHSRLTQSVFADTPKARAVLLGQKPIARGPSLFLQPGSSGQAPSLSSSAKLAENAAFLAAQERLPKSRRKTSSVNPKPIAVKNSGSVTPSASPTHSDFPSCRPITATNTYATTVSTPTSRTPRQLLTPLSTGSSEKLNEFVTQAKSKSEPRSDQYRDHLAQTFQALKFAKSLPPADSEQLASKRISLPRRKGFEGKKTIVFDLDETLVHCVESLSGNTVDAILPVKFPSGEVVKAGINIRPFVHDCLKAANKDFEVIVFTASHKCYADVVLNHLDPERELIHHRLYREHCISMQGVYIKDLRVLANRSLSQVVIVDNAAFSFAYQLNNGIPIVSWKDDKQDVELLNLIDYMKVLAGVEDIRVVNASTFHLSTFYEDYLIEFLNRSPQSPKLKKGRWLRRKAW